MINNTERLDNLECGNLFIIQDKNGYTFTMDAVLLANFARALKGYKVVDLGTGSAVIPILMSYKTGAKEICGVEIQKRLFDMASRSVVYNNLQDRIKLFNIDIKDAPDILGKEIFDVVTVNPPYSPFLGQKAEVTEDDICRYEVLISLDEIINASNKLLKYGGNLFLIIKASRLTDIISIMRKYKIEPKRLTPIQPTPKKPIDTIIIEGKKGARSGLIFDKPLVVLDENGEYTPELKKIYKQ